MAKKQFMQVGIVEGRRDPWSRAQSMMQNTMIRLSCFELMRIKVKERAIWWSTRFRQTGKRTQLWNEDAGGYNFEICVIMLKKIGNSWKIWDLIISYGNIYRWSKRSVDQKTDQFADFCFISWTLASKICN
jgi:hypothetical protein